MLTTAEQIRRVGVKEGVERGRKEGREVGREEGREEIVAHMLRAHVPAVQVSFFTGLDHAKIAEIAAKMDR